MFSAVSLDPEVLAGRVEIEKTAKTVLFYAVFCCFRRSCAPLVHFLTIRGRLRRGFQLWKSYEKDEE